MPTSRPLQSAPPARYVLSRELRGDALATAYLAHDRTGGRWVQLHVLHETLAEMLDAARWLDALQEVAALNSHHLVPLLDAGRMGETLYYALAHVEGVTAKDKLYAHGPAPIEEVVRILRAVTGGLVEAHGRGVFHGDLDPGHVLLADPEVMLAGTGVRPAMELAATGGAAAIQRLLGPSDYRAPELLGDVAARDHRTDVYGVGVLAAELLTGRHPFVGRSAQGPAATERDELPPVTLAHPAAPAAFIQIVTRCLATRPADRWESAAALHERLESLSPADAPGGGSSARDRIGPYRTLGVQGEGGMGVVYRAEQVAPVRRHVALKLIKLGMDTREVVARFEAERQALALLDHQGIAKVFDAGSTPTGRPYFVMELVDGMPLTAYADAHRLTVAARLALFMQVCDAVAHAHQKGIVHRDLKPDNVLVARDEQGRAWPKVIDFGVAKAIGGRRLTERTLTTSLGQILGTPQYMSPEQAGPASADVDTRADVFALGVMLYELLAGALPLDPDALESAPDPVAVIRDSEPPTPSDRYRSLGPSGRAVAAARGTEAHALLKTLAGDLDWIVMTAIEKDRERRYQTVRELSRDIAHYLGDEPVAARPPSPGYRMRKFVRRHRLGVSVGAVAAAGLVFGLGTTSMLMVRARRAEREAQRQASVSRNVSDFLVNLFSVSDPASGRGTPVTARQLLDRGAREMEADSTMDPLVRGRLLLEMGYAYTGLALYQQAAELLERSLALRTAVLGERHKDVAGTLVALGLVRLDEARYADAESLFTRAYAVFQGLGLGDSASGLAAARDLGIVYSRQGRFAEAEPLLGRVIRVLEMADSTSLALAGTLGNLALLKIWQGRFAQADTVLQRSLRIQERAVGSDHPEVVTNLTNLGLVYMELGRYPEAEAALRRGADIAERVLGLQHPALAKILNNLGGTFVDQERFAEAVPLLMRALGIKEQVLGPDHVDLWSTVANLGLAQAGAGLLAEAEALHRRSIGLLEATLGDTHPQVVDPLVYLAEVHLAQRRYGDAERVLRRALRIAGEEHPRYGRTAAALAEVYARTGRGAEADSVFAIGMAAEGKSLPVTHPEMRRIITRYASLLRRLGRAEEAVELEAKLADDAKAVAATLQQ
jgi:non-specific serine/threonine protein kinase/serine/threonine-protein kinase